MPETIDSTLFRETLGHYPTGVAVVAAVAADGKPDGMVVGTFSSISLDPPLIAFFPSAGSKSFAHIRTARAFSVNVLAFDQEPLCRRLATGGTGKFDGVRWRPGPLGSPILEGAVSWIECTFEEIRETGDHYIVLGRVRDLAVERSTLPLLFFQGGYGRFSPGSLVAMPDPELIQAAQWAEKIRSRLEDLSAELGVTCSVVAMIRWDAVQVLVTNSGADSEPSPLGQRQPLVPPFGAVFMLDAPETEVEEWLRRVPDDSQDRSELNIALLEKVREGGYSVLVAEPEALRRRHALLTEFEKSDRLPRQERVVRQATSELANLFCPTLVPGQQYDLANIIVAVPTHAGQPPMAVRMTGLPPAMPTERIESWIDRLKQVVAEAADEGVRRVP